MLKNAISSTLRPLRRSLCRSVPLQTPLSTTLRVFSSSRRVVAKRIVDERVVSAEKLLSLRRSVASEEAGWAAVQWRDDDPVFERVELVTEEEKQELARLYHEELRSDSVKASLEAGFMDDSFFDQSKVWERRVDHTGRAHGMGRRKSAVARVWIGPGEGVNKVNGMSPARYFQDMDLRKNFLFPLMAVDQVGEFDVHCIVKGGGPKGQAEAIRLAIARALQAYNPEWRPILRHAGLLTVDARVVERKKYGLKKARKTKQWKKR